MTQPKNRTEPPSRSVSRALLDREAVADESRILTFVASTSGTKRDGLDLDIAGLRTANFEANPVFLWAHDYAGRTLPIGKVTKLRKLKSRLDVDVEFDESDPFAQRVEQKYRDGYLNAVSIGWSIDEWEAGDDSDGYDFRITGSDLLDISAVPVPGDPDALIKTQRDLLASDGFVLGDVVPVQTSYTITNSYPSTFDDSNATTGTVQLSGYSTAERTAPVEGAGDEEEETLADAVRSLSERVDELFERIDSLPSGEILDRATVEALVDLTAIRDALRLSDKE